MKTKIKGLATRILEIKIANSSIWEWLAMIIGIGGFVLWAILVITLVNMKDIMIEIIILKPEIGGQLSWLFLLLLGIYASSHIQLVLPKRRKNVNLQKVRRANS